MVFLYANVVTITKHMEDEYININFAAMGMKFIKSACDDSQQLYRSLWDSGLPEYPRAGHPAGKKKRRSIKLRPAQITI